MLIKMTIDRFENDNAVLQTPEGRTIIWPVSHLPAGCQEGSVVEFLVSQDLKSELDQKTLAKDLLNEILNTNSA